jgi:hypothetical protein
LEALDDHLTAGAFLTLPVFNDVSLRLRQLIYPHALDGEWRAESSHHAESRVLTVYSRDRSIKLTAKPPEALHREVLADHRGWWASFGLISLLLSIPAALILRSLGKRVFGLGFDPLPRPKTPPEEALARSRRGDQILYQLSASQREAYHKSVESGEAYRIDLRTVDDPEKPEEGIDPAALAKAKFALMEGFEHRISEAPVFRSKLEILERLVYAPKLHVTLISRIDPLAYAKERATGKSEDNDEVGRWAAVLRSFERPDFVRQAEVANLPPELEPGTRSLLERECGWNEGLESVARDLADRWGYPDLTREQKIRAIEEAARAAFLDIWSSLTHREKLLLFQLAEQGLVNPGNWEVARDLEKRGFLVRTSPYRIVSESFRRFVLEECDPAELKAWQAATPSSWALLRVPLALLIILVAAFVFVTQPDTFRSSTAFIGAVSAGLPHLLRLASLLQGGRGGTALA